MNRRKKKKMTEMSMHELIKSTVKKAQKSKKATVR